MDLNELKVRAYNCACNRGLVDDKLSNSHYLCLIMCDIMDAVKADMEDKYLDKQNEIDDYVRGCSASIERSYEVYIKDTVEDKLADAAIGILSLAGLRSVYIKEFSDEDIEPLKAYNNERTLTENLYYISTNPKVIECKHGESLDGQLNCMLFAILGLACSLDIDLPWHVDQKLRYNELTFKK